jgi:hypothetical protein
VVAAAVVLVLSNTWRRRRRATQTLALSLRPWSTATSNACNDSSSVHYHPFSSSLATPGTTPLADKKGC